LSDDKDSSRKTKKLTEVNEVYLLFLHFSVPIILFTLYQSFKMSPTPQWVKDLKPSPPQGVDLIQTERDQSKISVEKLSNFLFTKEVLERQERILQILQSEKV